MSVMVRRAAVLVSALVLFVAGAPAYAATPVVTPIGNLTMVEGGTQNIPIIATDTDGHGLTLSFSSAPTAAEGFCSLQDNGDGSGFLDCDPIVGDADGYVITVTATDDGPGPLSASVQFTLTVDPNQVPTASAVTITGVASVGEDLTGSYAYGDAELDVQGTSTFRWLRNGNPISGALTTSYTVVTADAGTALRFEVTPVAATGALQGAPAQSGNFQVPNTPPSLTAIGPQSVAEGGSVIIGLNAADADGHGVSFSFSSAPTDAEGFCSLLDNGNGTGSLDCDPLAGDDGSYLVTVTVTDDGPGTESTDGSFTLTVSSNTPPSLAPIGPQSVAEGGTVNIGLSATDADGHGMSFSFSSAPTDAEGFCSLQDNGNGTGSLDCDPLAGNDGAYLVTVTVTDDGPVPAIGQGSFTLAVSANTPPSLTPIANQSMVEGESLNIPLSATDDDGHGMSYSILSVPPAAFCVLTDNGNGTGAIDCNPIVGNDGAYNITVTVTDNGPVPASASDPFTLTVGANAPPTADNVAITGVASVGEVLTGSYTYDDAELDAEGVSTFRWLRDGVAIPGALTTNYTVVAADVETALRFEVMPVAATGALQGAPVQSADFNISNSPPTITGQVVLETPEETPLTITLTDLTVTDTDNTYPIGFTLSVQDGVGYTRSGVGGNTITPDLDVNGPLTVPVTVNDGFADSAVFNLLVTVTPVNDAPQFGGLVAPLNTPEDTTLTIVITDLIILDPDNVPADFTLTLDPAVVPADNYTLAGASSITPAENFNGQLNVRATVSDLELSSGTFLIPVTVDAINDLPVLVAPIGPNNAIEDSPFNLDVSTNFSDADGEALNYTATWVPVKPPNVNFNGATGQFSGTPRFVDTEAPGPVYQVTVTALDPAGEFVSDTFELTISALGRANLDLSIGVTPDTGMPGDDLRWTFTSRNQVGPVAGANVELAGSFVGTGLTVTAEGGANCTIEAEVSGVTAFVCVLGSIPVGASTSTVLTTATSQASEVVSFGTVAGTEPIPIDPNLDDNSALEAAGVADAFSLGAVQNLGNASIRSVAAGDVNNDGLTDLVVGTAAGQGVQVFLGGLPRESCQCQRDFQTAPLSIPDFGSNEGVALGHFNNDTALDLVVANGGGQIDRVYLNDGAGNFSEVTPAPLGATFAQDVAAGDFDNDGDMDVVIAANGGNPVYLGNGNGGFNLHTTLGNANSVAVAVSHFDGAASNDLVFANVGSNSAVWTKNSGAGFTRRDQLNIGDAVAVAAADLNSDGRADIVFGRVSNLTGNNPRNPDTPSNPVMINSGNGTFPNTPASLLGVSPTYDVHIGDVNEDGVRDFVFVGASGVHQIWTANGGGYTLHSEQIIDGGAIAGVLVELGDADNGDPGGVDLAMGGAAQGGLGIYLNDSFGNLGRGDAVAPTLTLLGQATVSVKARTTYSDAGASAADNIDGDISRNVTVSGAVNISTVGDYILTYNVVDFAGNSATPITRTITVTPNTGGGGGTISLLTLFALLAGILRAQRYRATRSTRQKVV